MEAVFAGILKNRELCRIIMSKNGNPRFMERLKEMLRKSLVDGWCREFPAYNREDLNYVYDNILTGSVRLILDRIEDDNGISAAELARRLDRLGHYSHLAILEFQE